MEDIKQRIFAVRVQIETIRLGLNELDRERKEYKLSIKKLEQELKSLREEEAKCESST